MLIGEVKLKLSFCLKSYAQYLEDMKEGLGIALHFFTFSFMSLSL
jgi:hypothetical protein